MSRHKPIPQAAAIAVRQGRVCLITSTGGRRWVVPKGCHTKGKTAAQVALQEAWEEAGLVGVLRGAPVGSYTYRKAGKRYRVTVFLMTVLSVASQWPECKLRQRRWLRPPRAAKRIGHQGLGEVIRATFTFRNR
jgi:8-oxo-dGTP pyrophosphatase MutT (NUDIX family)